MKYGLLTKHEVKMAEYLAIFLCVYVTVCVFYME